MAWDSGTYRRDASKANRGKPFEDFINFANEKYQAKGIAVMHKVPHGVYTAPRGTWPSCKLQGRSQELCGLFGPFPGHSSGGRGKAHPGS